MVAAFALIIVVPWLNVANGTLASFRPLDTAVPTISLLSLNLLGKPSASLVHAAQRHLQDAGQLDSLRWRCDVAAQHSSGRIPAKLNLAHLDLEPRCGVVCDRARGGR